MKKRPRDISKEAWDASVMLCLGVPQIFEMEPLDEATVRECAARVIDQARREGYAAGVRAAAERNEALTVAASSVIYEAETLAMTKRRREVFNNLKAAYTAIRALDRRGGEV